MCKFVCVFLPEINAFVFSQIDGGFHILNCNML